MPARAWVSSIEVRVSWRCRQLHRHSELAPDTCGEQTAPGVNVGATESVGRRPHKRERPGEMEASGQRRTFGTPDEDFAIHALNEQLRKQCRRRSVST